MRRATACNNCNPQSALFPKQCFIQKFDDRALGLGRLVLRTVILAYINSGAYYLTSLGRSAPATSPNSVPEVVSKSKLPSTARWSANTCTINGTAAWEHESMKNHPWFLYCRNNGYTLTVLRIVKILLYHLVLRKHNSSSLCVTKYTGTLQAKYCK